MKAAVRFFCLVMPQDTDPSGFSYLDAINQTGLGVKACPIGPAFVMSAPWIALTHLFLDPDVELDKTFINVVCAPPNLSMGAVLKSSDMRPSQADNLPGVPPPGKEEVIYRPQTALAGLYTVGVANVAITSPRPQVPTEPELHALGQYDAVLVPSEDDALLFLSLGLTTFCVPPDAAMILPILRALLP